MSKLVSKQLVNFVKSFEGFSPTVYKDEVGVPTLGYGMTGDDIAGLDYVTEQQATQMLEDLLNNKYATPIKANLDSKGVVLNQNQFDALVSMAYNIGVGGLLGSTLYKNICAGVKDVATITANFTAWSKAGGQTLPGLLRRRQEEAAMFFGTGNTIEDDESNVHYIVCYNNDVDKRSALYLAEYLGCDCIDDRVTPFNYEEYYPICVGGGEFTSYAKLFLKGEDRYKTMLAVAQYIDKRR